MNLTAYLDKASEAYYSGNPFLTDAQFDYLADMLGYSKIGAKEHGKTAKHHVPMYSLQKYYPGEGKPPLQDYTGTKVTTPKLDGAAISLLYVNGTLVQALTRGDGEVGQVITDKFYASSIVPKNIDQAERTVQITGEIVAPKTIANARNYASGALALNSMEEFLTRDLYFVAYDAVFENSDFDYYTQRLDYLHTQGFKTVLDIEFCDNFPQDGIVTRVSNNAAYAELGFTSKHPRGAFATKTRSSGIATILREVIWQTGKSGKVTPVAIFDPVVIDGANVSRATLNNPGYIRALDLDIGDTVYVERAGGIIPSIIRSEKQA